MSADLHHDSFYDELPASVRTEVALEITNQVFEESSLLSVLVAPWPLMLTAAHCISLVVSFVPS